jgi:hypothetical protein
VRKELRLNDHAKQATRRLIGKELTRWRTGNGLQTDGEPSSDDDSDAEGEDDDDETDYTTVDWNILYFIWMANGWLSQCIFGGNCQRLSAQRPDQRWVHELLPSRHHADVSRHTTNMSAGGIIGDLTILIGLLALSVPYSQVEEVLRSCIRDLGTGGGWRSHGRPHQRMSMLPLFRARWSLTLV